MPAKAIVGVFIVLGGYILLGAFAVVENFVAFDRAWAWLSNGASVAGLLVIARDPSKSAKAGVLALAGLLVVILLWLTSNWVECRSGCFG